MNAGEPSGVPSRAPKTREDTRERFIAAAVEVFEEKGYGGTRVQEIARRAGLTAGALYAHFDSRTALLSEALMREGQRAFGDLSELVGSTPDENGPIVRMAADIITREPQAIDRLLLEAIAAAARDGDTRDRLLPAVDQFAQAMTGQIHQAQERGAIGSTVPDDAVRVFFMVLTLGSITARALALPRGELENMEDLLARMLAALEDPIAPGEDPPG